MSRTLEPGLSLLKAAEIRVVGGEDVSTLTTPLCKLLVRVQVACAPFAHARGVCDGSKHSSC
jgi:hypothetical protein